ncbi:MAG TPA: LysR substrate-binding domain-containing protein, partial [Gemmatimonadaceae bacterium]
VNDFYFEPYIRSDTSDLIRETLIKGLGVAHAPTWMMAAPERDGHLVRLLEEYCTGHHAIFVVAAGPQPMSAKQEAFASFLKRQFANNPELRIAT